METNSKPLTKCLVIVFHPPGLLAALGAVMTLHEERDVEVSVIANFPAPSDVVNSEMRAVFTTMTQPFPFIRRVHVFTNEEMQEKAAWPIARLKADVFPGLPGDYFTEIIYPHDVGGELYPLCCEMYPFARRICCGESFGIYVEKSSFLRYLSGHEAARVRPQEARDSAVNHIVDLARRLKSMLTRVGRRLGSPGRKRGRDGREREYPPDLLVLALPVDQFGDMARRSWIVCKKSAFLGVLEKTAEACVDLNRHIESLISRTQGKKRYLLLTENIAESGRLSLEVDVAMYAEIVRTRCEPGSAVLIKSHPGAWFPRSALLRESLGNEYTVLETDLQFQRYPVELWKKLILESEVICCAYPVLSLKYIYDKTVIQPVDEPFLAKWFPPPHDSYFRDAIGLYVEPLKALDNWDGKSVLFRPAPQGTP